VECNSCPDLLCLFLNSSARFHCLSSFQGLCLWIGLLWNITCKKILT
jgi:hypothetical protein